MQKVRTVHVIFRENIGRATTMFLIPIIALVYCQSERSFKQQLAMLKKLTMTLFAQTMGLLAAVYY